MIKVSTSILTCNNRIQATEELNKTNIPVWIRQVIVQNKYRLYTHRLHGRNIRR